MPKVIGAALGLALVFSASPVSSQTTTSCPCIHDLTARAKNTAISLAWTADANAVYEVFRSNQTQGQAFLSIGQTARGAGTFTDLNAVLNTLYHYRVQASTACLSPTISIVSRSRSTNRPPTFTSSPATLARETETWTYQAIATDPDGNSLRYWLDQSPPGMTIDTISGQIQWTPSHGASGMQCIHLRVSDGGYSALQPFALNVSAASASPPVIVAHIAAAPNSQGWYRDSVRIEYQCTAGGAPIASCEPPTWITAEGRNLLITGSVTDSAGQQGYVETTLRIDRTAPDLAVLSPADFQATNQSAITITGAVSDSLSGLAGITCQGLIATVSATLTEGQFQCSAQLSEGENTLVILAEDSAGNQRMQSLSLNRDQTGPVLTRTWPALNWRNTNFILVTALANERLDSAHIAGQAATVSDFIMRRDSVPLAPGETVVTLSAWDTLGNRTDLSFVNRLDSTFPELNWVEPKTGAYSQTPAGFKLVMRDVGSGLDTSTLSLFINGSEYAGPKAWLGDTLIALPDTAPLFHEGRNFMTATVRDSAGNFGQAFTQFQVDAHAPVLVIETPQHQTTLEDLQVNVRLRYADSGVGIRFSSLAVHLNGADILPQLQDDQGLVTGKISLPSGTYHLIARVADTLGNVAADTAEFLLPTPEPALRITEPANLSTVTQPDIVVRGNMNRPMTSVVIEGVPATLNGNTFQALVPLGDSRNVLMAVAKDAVNRTATATVTVTLDRSSPTLDLTSPPDSLFTKAESLAVSGILFDKVATENHRKSPTVKVNGRMAMVENSTFFAMASLAAGWNSLTAVVTDQNGNSQNRSVSVFRDTTDESSLRIVSGNAQADTVLHEVPDPLQVQAIDASGLPLPNRDVLFRVEEGSGIFPADGKRLAAVRTNAQGRASIRFRLGHKAGAGCNRVRAQVVGLGEAWFHLRALPRRANKINTVSGDYQIGLAGAEAPKPLSALVTDTANNPIQGMPVTFTVVQGGGYFGAGAIQITDTTGVDGRVATTFFKGQTPGRDNNKVEANFPGNPGLPATFVLSGLKGGHPDSTKVSGLIHDNTNLPVPGVTVTIAENGRQAVSNAQGQFTITRAPVGNLHFKVDGSTATRPGDWTTLEFELVSVPGENNTLGMPIYLTQMATADGKLPSLDKDVVLEDKRVPGFKLTVKKGSTTFPLDQDDHTISVTQVHSDKIPMPPGEGMQPNYIVAIMPHNAKFYPPAPVCFPNTDGFEPGRQTNMYSFDHDMGTFVPIGTGTVTEDASQICSDKGFGIVKGGWHCAGPSNPNGVAYPPEVDILEPDQDVCPGEEVHFSATWKPSYTPPFGSVSWQGGDSDLTPNQDVASYSPVFKTSGQVGVTYICESRVESATASRKVSVIKITEIKINKQLCYCGDDDDVTADAILSPTPSAANCEIEWQMKWPNLGWLPFGNGNHKIMSSQMQPGIYQVRARLKPDGEWVESVDIEFKDPTISPIGFANYVPTSKKPAEIGFPINDPKAMSISIASITPANHEVEWSILNNTAGASITSEGFIIPQANRSGAIVIKGSDKNCSRIYTTHNYTILNVPTGITNTIKVGLFRYGFKLEHTLLNSSGSISPIHVAIKEQVHTIQNPFNLRYPFNSRVADNCRELTGKDLVYPCQESTNFEIESFNRITDNYIVGYGGIDVRDFLPNPGLPQSIVFSQSYYWYFQADDRWIRFSSPTTISFTLYQDEGRYKIRTAAYGQVDDTPYLGNQ